ncbi:hypothetical protein VUR80DRAFT_10087 [Thermomyces stellatus]
MAQISAAYIQQFLCMAATATRLLNRRGSPRANVRAEVAGTEGSGQAGGIVPDEGWGFGPAGAEAAFDAAPAAHGPEFIAFTK